MSILVVAGSLLILPAPTGGEPGELAPPVPVLVDGQPLDVGRDGHSAPFAADFDGDGRRDLLVGQYHEGRLRVYRNQGDDRRPRFRDYTWFEADGRPGRVPEG